MEKFRADTKLLDANLVSQVYTAWRAFLRNEVAVGLPSDERALFTENDGELDSQFSQIAELIQNNKEWKQECLKRDEKFDMNFTSAVRTLRKLLPFCFPFEADFTYIYRTARYRL